MMIQRKSAQIPVLKKANVVVVGGGPAGVGAAVAAARQGAKVLLIEKNGFLGGNITACYVENCNYFLKSRHFTKLGLYGEIVKNCYRKYTNDNVREFNRTCFSSETLKVYLDDLMADNGVEVLLHSFVNEVILSEDHVDAVIIQTKKGPAAVIPGMVIDTTGDGDVAFAAGIPFEQGREEDGLCQPGTVNMRLAGADTEALLRDGDQLQAIGRHFKKEYRAGRTGLSCIRQDIPFGRLTKAGQISYVNYTCEYGLDPTSVEDLSKGEAACRRYGMEIYQYLKTHYEPLRNIELASFAPTIGFRDSRRIKGLYRLTIEDMETQKHFDDCIAAFPRFYDMLSPDANMGGNGKVEGKGYQGHIFEPVTDDRMFEIPYRCLIPFGTTNMLMAGRCISADHVAESGVRAISLCMMMGEAAGTAAWLALSERVKPDMIDVLQLQEKLRESNLCIPDGKARHE